MESNDKEAVDDGFESYEDSEDFEDAGQVSCNNITKTLIQISRLFYFGFFSKTNNQMII